jgi:hypothetical protein
MAYLEIIRIFTVCYLGRKGRSLTTNAQGKKIGVRRVRKTDRKALFRSLKTGTTYKEKVGTMGVILIYFIDLEGGSDSAIK